MNGTAELVREPELLAAEKARATQALALTAPPVTSDQIELIKRTVANGATADELKLYLYDCARQGVHPLDKLIHFTKRAGKYTPVTSIDFMRIRAADTGEYAGSDAALYAGTEGVWSSLWTSADPPFAALVTVWRLVQGQRCKFEAVARWSEYKPDQDFMWRKMPGTMLAKCAEALALRKGFPRQLAGLYAKEEMDQAGGENGSPLVASPVTAPVLAPVQDAPPPRETSAPIGAVGALIRKVEEVPITSGKMAGRLKWFVHFEDGVKASTIDKTLAARAREIQQAGARVQPELKKTNWGYDLMSLHVVPAPEFAQVDHGMPTEDEIPF